MKPQPNARQYIRAHQYLYYVLHNPILTDYEFDMFGRDSGEDYKGGSDRAADYTEDEIELALDIKEGVEAPLPTLDGTNC